MYCVPNECTMSELACLCNRKIAINAMRKISNGKNITMFELRRVLAYRQCEKANREVGEAAIERFYALLGEFKY